MDYDLVQIIGDHFGWVLMVGGILLAMIIKAITSVVTTSAHERTRREIAAYVAEGSMTPEQGERLLRADMGRRYSNCG